MGVYRLRFNIVSRLAMPMVLANSLLAVGNPHFYYQQQQAAITG